MTKRHRVAVVDDHPVVRRGIVETFAEEPDFDVVGQGGSAADAAALVAQGAPDLILLDVTMPGNGIEAAAQISKLSPATAILMLSIREDLATVRSAFRAGARGYVSKGVGAEDLTAAARRVLHGERYVTPELGARLIAEPTDPAQSESVIPMASLTARERQIYELLGEGLSNLQIANRIGLTENTVKHYMTPLMHKLGVKNRTEAALLARQGSAGAR